ncbi:MAG: hypothetical protein AAF702_08295 [Chloroflexota bacterium]
MIRPFQLGDLLLVQRLGRQAAKLNIIQALLQPRPAMMIALGAVLPWAGGKANTYILRQQKNSLAQAGFIQASKRPSRAEADITFLAPALDTEWGHPAIWKKLLAHFVQEAAAQQINRIYADVPDQPLPVQTFSQIGFKLYTRQTIWRLNRRNAAITNLSSTEDMPSEYILRPLAPQDQWSLRRLYSQVTPKEVQLAEGTFHERVPFAVQNGHSSSSKYGQYVKPLILSWWHSSYSQTYVLTDDNELKGSLLIGRSHAGYWLRLLIDTSTPNTDYIHALLRYGLIAINAPNVNRPIYIGVRSYHGGMQSILSDYGFAPFTDVARMMRHVPLLARLPIRKAQPVLDPIHSPVPSTYMFPKQSYRGLRRASFKPDVSQHNRRSTPRSVKT